jgi:hypothetical protein
VLNILNAVSPVLPFAGVQDVFRTNASFTNVYENPFISGHIINGSLVDELHFKYYASHKDLYASIRDLNNITSNKNLFDFEETGYYGYSGQCVPNLFKTHSDYFYYNVGYCTVLFTLVVIMAATCAKMMHRKLDLIEEEAPNKIEAREESIISVREGESVGTLELNMISLRKGEMGGTLELNINFVGVAEEGESSEKDITSLETGEEGQTPEQNITSLEVEEEGQMPKQNITSLEVEEEGQMPKQNITSLEAGQEGQMPKQNITSLEVEQEGQMPKQNVKCVTLEEVLLIGTQLIIWVPFLTTVIYFQVAAQVPNPKIPEIFLLFVIPISSLLNPLFYSGLRRKLAEACKKAWRCMVAKINKYGRAVDNMQTNAKSGENDCEREQFPSMEKCTSEDKDTEDGRNNQSIPLETRIVQGTEAKEQL